MKMEDGEVMVYIGMLKKIEDNVKKGGEGLSELMELVEWGYDVGLENERIVLEDIPEPYRSLLT